MTLIIDLLIGAANQTCVYWAKTGSDRYGNPTYASPVELDCRWETSVGNSIGADGSQYSRTARVYLRNVIEVDGYLWLGTLSTAPATPPQYGRIRNADTFPAITNDETLYVASV